MRTASWENIIEQSVYLVTFPGAGIREDHSPGPLHCSPFPPILSQQPHSEHSKYFTFHDLLSADMTRQVKNSTPWNFYAQNHEDMPRPISLGLCARGTQETHLMFVFRLGSHPKTSHCLCTGVAKPEKV
jgi:hypothetical protein